MSDNEVSLDVSADFTDFGTTLSPLGGGTDPEFEYEYVDADDDTQCDGSVEVHFTDSGRKQIKKIKKKAAKPVGTVGDAAVKLTAIAIDAMATPVGVVQNNGAIQKGKWSTGLFNCFDFCVPNCFMVALCPCISAAQIAARLGFAYSSALTVFGVLVTLEYIAYGLMSATMRSTELQTRYYYSYITGRYTTYTYEVTTSRLSYWAYIAYVLSVVTFIALWQLRTKMRSTFDLPGSCVEDLFVSFFCSWCSLAQMATHVKSYKPHTCDFGAPDELPAYSE
jgi:Cys-rich protein (TIGR01571 family)